MRAFAAALVVIAVCACSLIADLSETMTESDQKGWGVSAGIALVAFGWWLVAGGDK